jgi:predicted acyltransferase
MNKRILSIDIFRGLTIAFMILVNTPGTWSHVFPPLEHASWHGITPTDLIFPFFLFIVGTSIVLAYANKRQYIDHNLYRKIIIRSVKIIFLGLFLAAFVFHFPFIKDLSQLRLPGVLQRIGLVFLISALLFVKIKKWKWYLFILILLLGGYWYAMTQISINGAPPQLTKTHNLASVIDRQVLGVNHMWKHYEKSGYIQGDYDPEGLFSTLPAVGTTILGIFLGLVLIDRRISPYAKFIIFVGLGILLWLLGWWWSHYFPLNKRLWTRFNLGIRLYSLWFELEFVKW